TPGSRTMLPCQKSGFSLPEGLHYLNCAYMGPLSARVEEAGIAGIRRRRDPTSITPADFFPEADAVRERFARLVNAPDPRQVALVPAVSYGLAVVARNTPLGHGQNVVVVGEQFPSNVYPWRRMAAGAGAEVRTVAAPEGAQGRGEGWNARILEAIDPRTALVALGHVHWADGTRFDLESIGARAREVGAALVVDGTQSVGALPFDVQRIRPDALVCASYKWLMGPYGAGTAWFGPRYLDGVPLEENWIAREGSEDFAGLVRYREAYQPGALRYDVGERSNPVLLPMLRAALDQLLEWTPEAVQAYCRALTAGLVEEARALGYAVEDERWRGAHLFGLRAPAGVELSRVQEALARRRVAVSVRGSAVRVSPNVYNDAADVAALRDALREAAA
ncbi:MAG TPA: aminotransferase class V-fold PLP-dependent enzyme, partial [Longimicrobiaceae bacterium]|nr:aminotransferase class V-fold PLP-dependent enzyme [Longimicrobiaceae bacterium]